MAMLMSPTPHKLWRKCNSMSGLLHTWQQGKLFWQSDRLIFKPKETSHWPSKSRNQLQQPVRARYGKLMFPAHVVLLCQMAMPSSCIPEEGIGKLRPERG